MERLSERFMSRYEDGDLAIWVCPADHEVREFPLDGPEPDRTVCSECGKDYVQRCPNSGCPSRAYHWTDHPTKFHKCREPIPWSWWHDQRAGEWPEHRSKLLGTRKLSDAEKLIKSRTSASPSGLSYQERQDLIAPPSERTPISSNVASETSTRDSPARAQQDDARQTWDGLERKPQTWDELERKSRIDAPISVARKRVRLAGLGRGLSHLGTFTYAVLVVVVGGLILLGIGILLYSQGVRSL